MGLRQGTRRCRVCGKLRYATREAAEAVIARAWGGHRVKRAHFAHGWWHLTSKEKRLFAVGA